MRCHRNPIAHTVADGVANRYAVGRGVPDRNGHPGRNRHPGRNGRPDGHPD
jgi:hypothetical protein